MWLRLALLGQWTLTTMPSFSGSGGELVGLQRSPSPIPSALQIKYHEEFEKSRMGPSGGEGVEPERREPQDSSSYRRPPEQQQPQPHHIPTSAPGEYQPRDLGTGGRGPEVRRTGRKKETGYYPGIYACRSDPQNLIPILLRM